MNSIFRLQSIRTFHTTTSVTFPKRWKEKSEVPFQSELTNPVAEVYGPTESWPENEVRKKNSSNFFSCFDEFFSVSVWLLI